MARQQAPPRGGHHLVAIVVASDDPKEIEHAADTLKETSPLRLERLDTGDRLVTP